MFSAFLRLYLFKIFIDIVKGNGDPLITIEHSKVTYRGSLSDSIEHFHNIKFAHETSGKRRFAPPEPFTPPPNTIVDASLPGPACPQLPDAMPPFFSEVKDISEDCLHLRISRPAGLEITSESKLPVVVWLYGGGVVKGSSTDDHFDPTNMLKLSVSTGQPVIYAALNYRLSIFGFARLPILKRDKSMNVGVRDQRAGFQWIKDNIQQFGGDPDRITVYGLSAGGTFTSLHPMMFGGAQGVPFQQAWMMSGPPGTALNISSDMTIDHTTAVAENSGCGGLVDAKMLECLRNLPMQDLIKSAMEYSIANHPPNGLFTFIPSLDDDIFPQRPSKLMREGNFVKGAGHLIQNEEDMIVPIKRIASNISAEQLAMLFSLYPASSFEEELRNYDARKGPEDPSISVHYFRISRILRDVLFTCSSIDYGYHMVKHTQMSHDPEFTGVRLYDLNQSALTSLWKAFRMPYIGVSHGSDTNYIFNGVFPEGQLDQADKELSEMFTMSLINFAYTGDPISKSASLKQFNQWPESYENSGSKETDRPSNINVQVIGGPYGTGPVSLSGDIEIDEGLGSVDQKMAVFQQVLTDALNFKSMESANLQERKRLVHQEDLLTRCEYVNSLAETLGV